MTRVLVIGYAPDAVDFTDPAIPPGLNEDLVAEGRIVAAGCRADQGDLYTVIGRDFLLWPGSLVLGG